jgi:hypothetical protein
MLGGGTAALALALLQPSPVHAQTAFQGVPTVVTPGSAIVQQAVSPGEDVITVLAPQAIINWRIANPAAGNINFLPLNRTGRFVGFNNFVVLNRILPVTSIPGVPDIPLNRLIELNGTITSGYDLINQNQGFQRGGSVWFYNAGGILVGSSAVINVGSLVLTSNDINTTGGLFGPVGDIRFVGTPNSGPVTVSNGATINASDFLAPGGSYVALVAPRVVQAGTIDADGSIALIAAEQTNVQINNGLFDIDVVVGTDDPNGIVHANSATTGGPVNGSGGASVSNAYFVAVPKNTAITMLLSGTVGYGGMSAIAQDGAIVIASGRGVTGGEINPDPQPSGSPEANIQISDFTARNNLAAYATTGIDIFSSDPSCTNCTIFGANGNLVLTADDRISITVGRGQRVDVAGDLTVRATNEQTGIGGNINIVAGVGGINASNPTLSAGAINVVGELVATTYSRGVDLSLIDGDGQGGTITVTADGGAINARAVRLDSGAIGDISDSGLGATGFGGSALLSAVNGGSINTDFVEVLAEGTGGGIRLNPLTGLRETVAQGGNGVGGDARIRTAAGGAIRVANSTQFALSVVVGANGIGTAGIVSDGDGTGGTASITVADAASSFSGRNFSVRAQGLGGSERALGTIGPAIRGGNGTGGTAEIQANGQLTGTEISIDASASSYFARANPQFPNAGVPTGGNALGGNARMVVNGASLTGTDISILAEANGGNVDGLNGVAGSGEGGETSLTMTGAASVNATTRVYLSSVGEGGLGQGTSGDGTGGNATLDVGATAQLRTPRLEMVAQGTGGGAQNGGPNSLGSNTVDGGDGFGGNVVLRSAGLIDVAGDIDIFASGSGGQAVAVSGDPRAPQGGSGTGGSAQLTADGGEILTGGNLFVGTGGIAANGANASGDAEGGAISLTATPANGVAGAIRTVGNTTLQASAQSTTGTAQAGTITVNVTGGEFSGNGLLDANANAFGPDGTGGAVTFTVANGMAPLSRIGFGNMFLSANGTNAGRIALFDMAASGGLEAASLTASATGTASPTSGIVVESTDGPIDIGGDILLDAGGEIRLTATGSGGLRSQTGSVTLRATGNISGTHGTLVSPTITSGGAIDIQASGLVSFGPGTAMVANGLGRIVGGTGVTLASVSTGTTLTITATTGDATLDNGASGEGTTISGANVTVNKAATAGLGSAPTDITINATNNVTVGTLNSADNIVINAREMGTNTAALTAGQAVNLNITDSTAFGSINAGTNVTINAGSVNAGTITAGGTIDAISPGDVLLAGTTSVGSTTINGRAVRVQNALTTGATSDIVLTGTESAGVGTANAARDVRLTSTNTAVNYDSITAGRDAILSGATIFAIGSTLNAARTASLTAPGLIWVGNVTGAAGVIMTSGDFITADTVRATAANAAVTINALNNLRLTSVRSEAGTVTMTAGTALIDSAYGATSVDLTTTADATMTNTQSGGAVSIRSTGGGVSAQTVNAAGAVALIGAGTVTSANVTSTGGSINVAGLNVGVGTANAASTLTIQGGNNVSLTDGTSGGTMTITGAGVVVQAARTTGAAADIILNSTTQGSALGAATAGRDIRINSADFIQLSGAQNAGRDISLTGSRLIANGQSINATRAINVATTGNTDFGSMAAGQGVTIASGGRVVGTAVSSTGAGSIVDITGATNVTLGSVTSGGSAVVRSSGAGVAVDTATSATTLTITGVGDVALTNGTSGGTATLSGQNVTVGTLTANGAASDISLTATQTATIGNATAGRDIAIAAATVAAGNGVLNAARAINATTTGNASFGTLVAGGGMTLASGGTLTGTSARTTAGALSLNGATGLTFSNVQSAATTALSAANGALVVNDLQSVGAITASGRSAQIGTNGAANFAGLTATAGDARVTAASGNLSVSNGSATGTLALTTTAGNLTTGQLSGGAIAVTSNGSATLNGATTAIGTLGITAAGNAAINAVATGTSVTVGSGNIAIGTTGRLGTAGTTTSLTLSNTDTSSRTFIGGADVTTGYSLSAAEMLRLFGSNITINAPRAATQGGGTLGASRPPDVVIGAFTLQGGATAAGNLGANGTLTIATPGSARVNGAVALDSMTATNRFALNATEAIEVIAGQGTIRLTNGGSLSGVLDLQSDDIAVATSAAITAIAGLTDINAIDDRLGQNDGVTSDEGMLAAGGIRMTVRNGVYIQNSGSGTRLADRRGFTTGAGGLTILSAGPTTRIVINGRIPNAAGTLTTGRDTIPLINIIAGGPVPAAGQYDLGSTANGCLIANPASCTEGDNVPPVQDIISDTADGSMGDTPFALLIELRELEPFPGEPLIDDPVTGTGNDDLWEAPCEPAEGQETCP